MLSLCQGPIVACAGLYFASREKSRQRCLKSYAYMYFCWLLVYLLALLLAPALGSGSWLNCATAQQSERKRVKGYFYCASDVSSDVVFSCRGSSFSHSVQCSVVKRREVPELSVATIVNAYASRFGHQLRLGQGATERPATCFAASTSSQARRQRRSQTKQPPCWELLVGPSPSSEAQHPSPALVLEDRFGIFRLLPHPRSPLKMIHLVPVSRSKLNYHRRAGTFPPSPHLPLFTMKMLKVTSIRAESMPST